MLSRASRPRAFHLLYGNWIGLSLAGVARVPRPPDAYVVRYYSRGRLRLFAIQVALHLRNWLARHIYKVGLLFYDIERKSVTRDLFFSTVFSNLQIEACLLEVSRRLPFY